MPDAAVAAATALVFFCLFLRFGKNVEGERERERRPNDDKIYVDVDGS